MSRSFLRVVRYQQNESRIHSDEYANRQNESDRLRVQCLERERRSAKVKVPVEREHEQHVTVR